MRFYTVIEAAKLLNIHPETVRRYIRESKIGFLPGAGRQGYRITSEHLRAFLVSNPSMTTPELLSALSDSGQDEKALCAKTNSLELEKLAALRLQKLEELQRIDDLIILKKQNRSQS